MFKMTSNLSTVFQGLSKTISSHSGAIQGILSAGIVAGINQLVEFAAFECPCVMEKAQNATALDCPCAVDGNRNTTNCSIQNAACSTQDRSGIYSYGLLYIFVPAAMLFLFGFVANEKFCRRSTGCFRTKKSGVKRNIKGFGNAFGSSTVPFVTWVVLSLIDGDYLACSLTTFPYEFSEGQTCKTPTVRLFEISGVIRYSFQ